MSAHDIEQILSQGHLSPNINPSLRNNRVCSQPNLHRSIDTQYQINLANMDNLLNHFSNEKTKIIQMLMSDIETLIQILWTERSPISHDDHCLCRMGLYPQGITIGNNAICPSCRMIGRLTNLNKDSGSCSIVLEYAKYKGYKLDVRSYHCNKFFIFKRESMTFNAQRFLVNHNEYIACEPDLEYAMDSIYIGSDRFTNQMLNTWALESILSLSGLPSPQQMHHGFVCGNVGYGLYDFPDIGSIRDLALKYTNNDKVMKVEHAIQLTRQLICILHALHDYAFSHGSPSIQSMKFSVDKVNCTYKGKELNCNFSLHLSNFDYSSISIHYIGAQEDSKNIFRLYCHSNKTVNVDHIDNESKIEQKRFVNGSHEILTFRLPKNINDYIVRLRHTGVALHRSSYDLYSFWMSLMLYTPYRQAISQSPEYMNLWRELWISDEYQIVDNKLNNNNNYEIHNNPTSWLQNLWLRCSAIEHIFDKLPHQ